MVAQSVRHAVAIAMSMIVARPGGVTVAVGILSSSWCDFRFVNAGPADDRSAVRPVLENGLPSVD
jgi:hypothetical protein